MFINISKLQNGLRLCFVLIHIYQIFYFVNSKIDCNKYHLTFMYLLFPLFCYLCTFLSVQEISTVICKTFNLLKILRGVMMNIKTFHGDLNALLIPYTCERISVHTPWICAEK